jgi:hypothetical protein
MAQVHMTEAELARDLHAVLEKVQNGAAIVIEQDHQSIAVMKPPQPVRRSLSELIGLAEQRERDRGKTVTLDEDFAADIEAIVHARMPSTPRSWD